MRNAYNHSLARRAVRGVLRRRALACAQRDARGLHAFDFSIASDDCWGGEIYRLTSARFATPFVGMIIPPPSYIRILQNLPLALQSNLVQADRSRYPDAERERQGFPLGPYPVGILTDVDAEILFMHYDTWEDAHATWMRRRGRFNVDDPFVKLGTHRGHVAGSDDAILDQFAALPFRRKLIVSDIPFAEVNTAIAPYHYNVVTRLHRGAPRFDHVAWLNGGDGQVSSSLQRFIRTVKYGGWW